MKDCVLLLAFSFLTFFNVNSQNLTEDFNLLMPEAKIKSVYTKLTVIDARIDTTSMGVIQKGAFNRKAFLKPTIPLKKQIQDLFVNMVSTESPAASELLLNVRDFKFAEVTEAFTETGYCYLRADLFSKKDSMYQKIDSVDAVYEVNSTDVTKKNIRNGSNKLIDFISSNVNVIKSGPNYSFNDILNITSIEKRKIPVYNTATYKDGIYHTFDRFKNIEPSSSQFELTRNKKGKITKLERIWNSGASRAEVKPSDIFCVVQNGKIYMASDYGFAPAEFKNDDFYFQGKAKVTAKTGNVILATAFFGIIGGIIAGDATSEFEMKVDHLNGSTVLIKQINK